MLVAFSRARSPATPITVFLEELTWMEVRDRAVPVQLLARADEVIE